VIVAHLKPLLYELDVEGARRVYDDGESRRWVVPGRDGHVVALVTEGAAVERHLR